MSEQELEADVSEPEPQVTTDSAESTRIPFPIVTGGIGLIVAYSFAGGMSGGQGFLIGFFAGLGILVVSAILQPAFRQNDVSLGKTKCPECGARLTVCVSEPPTRTESLLRVEGDAGA